MEKRPDDRYAEMIRRVAIHEAGHVISAWYSRTGVTVKYTVLIAAVVGGRPVIGGLTQVPWRKFQPSPKMRDAWGYLVTLMGGIAAELRVLGRADPSGDPRSDLAVAAKVAGLMAWSAQFRELRRRHRGLGCERLLDLIDRDQLEKDVMGLISLALKDAGVIIRRRRSQFRKVSAALLERGFLNHDDLEELIGRPPRPAKKAPMLN